MTAGPRIALIHALRESQLPSWQAFEAGWPEAQIFNLLDDSLSSDFAAVGQLTSTMRQRFLTLGRYVAATDADGLPTRAILFTCSAFGAAIDAVRRDLAIPVLRPNEAAFEAALERGRRIALLTSFASSLPPLIEELKDMAAAHGAAVEIVPKVAEGALDALKAGDGEAHDRLAAEAARTLPAVDVLVLTQFSLARAAPRVAATTGLTVLTTPAAAVAKLKSLLG